MSIATHPTAALLRTSVNTAFQGALNSVEDPLWSAPYTTPIPKDGSDTTTFEWLAQDTHMREWIGARELNDLKERAFSVKTKKYEKSHKVKVDELENNERATINYQSEIAAMHGRAVRELPDDLAGDVLLSGQSIVCYDGQNFFDTDHPVDIDAVTGTQSNYEASLALDETNLFAMRTRMAGFTAEDGRSMKRAATELWVVPSLELAARKLLIATNQANGASNVANGIMTLKVLTDLQAILPTTAWFVVDGRNIGPGIFLKKTVRPPRTRTTLGREGTHEFLYDEILWGVDTRVGIHPGIWSKIIKAVG